MLIRLSMWLCEVSPRFKRVLWRRWYQYLAGYKRADWKFMNYGFTSLTNDEPVLRLQPDDEPNRYSIQLYHRVASAVPLAGLDVLEVGCGRGGGASFVKRYHQPLRLTGVDFSAKAVRFCRDHHRLEGLSFVPGDAVFNRPQHPGESHGRRPNGDQEWKNSRTARLLYICGHWPNVWLADRHMIRSTFIPRESAASRRARWRVICRRTLRVFPANRAR